MRGRLRLRSAPAPTPSPFPLPLPPPRPLRLTLPLPLTRYALRCARCKDEGAAALRVVRASPAAAGMVERPVVNYESVIGGMLPSYHPH